MDKKFIYFKPKLVKDSLSFTLKSPEANIEYFGVNFKDSLQMYYQTVNNFGGKETKIKLKTLNFKFYPL